MNWPLIAQSSDSFWFPQGSSSVSEEVDSVFYFILGISAFFFLLISALLVVFVVRYRWQKYEKPEKSPAHNTPLELLWTLIPLGIVGVIFYLGFTTYMNMRVAHGNAEEIQVTGQKWKWFFTYSNGYVDDELHVPVGKAVRLLMASEDVIHSLFIPAFRIKQDVVPGRYSTTWFKAVTPGKYPVLCAEYCGTKHSEMVTSVIVHEPGGFETWLAAAGDILANATPVEAGEKLYRLRACSQCHSVDGKAGIGPSFKGIYGIERPLQDGSFVTVDENYIRESIIDPQKKIAAGFNPVMPTYKGKLSDKEISAIIAYIKELKESK